MFSQQRDEDNARITREAEREIRRDRDRLDRIEARLDDLETFEAYVRDELVPYIADIADFVIYALPPPEPPP